MTDAFALAAFLGRWAPHVAHDLASSESETLTLRTLLDLAGPDDLRRWETLDFGYIDPRGAPWLRAAIADLHPGLEPEDILCCAGAQEALTCVVASLLGPRDHAVVVLPIYQPSEDAVTGRCLATGILLREEDRWQLDLDRVEAALKPNTRLVMMNFPNSPTGAVLETAKLHALIDLCRARGLWLINDEVYRHTDPREACRPTGVSDLYERGVSIDSLSKGFGLAGLRVGWIACRDRTVRTACLDAKNRISSCLSATSEVLAHMALKAKASILDRNRTIGARSRMRLKAVVERHLDVLETDVSDNLAFAFLRFHGGEADRFALALALDAGVLVLPSSLWRSRLASVPVDRLRIGLGRLGTQSALDAFNAYLSTRSASVRFAN